VVERIALPRLHYVLPQAEGNVWYPQSFLEKLEENEPALSQAIAVIDALIDSIVSAGTPERMTGVIATVLAAMRGLRSVTAGRMVLRDGYRLYEDKYRPGVWFVCTLTGMEDDYAVAPDGRELCWFDRRVAEDLPPCPPQLEPEVLGWIAGVAAARRDAWSRGGLRK
jgi:hypothetical protein